MSSALTAASPSDLPPLGDLVADDPFWRYSSAAPAGEGVAHLRVWATATAPPGHLAVVTETGLGASITGVRRAHPRRARQPVRGAARAARALPRPRGR